MGRPRGHTYPAGVLPVAMMSNNTGNSSAFQVPSEPLSSAQLPSSVQEDLESQARASVSLFGFGCFHDAHWTTVALPDSGSVKLRERVCPIGHNAFLWNLLTSESSSGDNNNNDEELEEPTAMLDAATGATFSESSSSDSNSNTSGQYTSSSKVLQQYMVKSVVQLAATKEEVIDLIIRSDRERDVDLTTAMQFLAGVKMGSAGLVFRRKSKRLRYSHWATSSPAYESDGGYSSSSSNDSDSSESDEDRQQQQQQRQQFQQQKPLRKSSRQRRRRRRRGTSSNNDSGLCFPHQYTDMYENRGNLSIKWVTGDKLGRVFSTRVNYCLLDYEGVLVNDWEDTKPSKKSLNFKELSSSMSRRSSDSMGATHDPSLIFFRVLQSCYLPQCQPWMDEMGVRPTDMQPAGIMVRESRSREGYVEVQLVASILEQAHWPVSSGRAKLRALCGKLHRLEEILTSRRLSRSLFAHQQPLWVRNAARTMCRCCEVKFSFSRRRHHCRLCGEVVCSECSPKMEVALPSGNGAMNLRVCVICLRVRREDTHPLKHTGSYSTLVQSAAAASMSMSSELSGSSNSTHSSLPDRTITAASKTISSERRAAAEAAFQRLQTSGLA